MGVEPNGGKFPATQEKPHLVGVGAIQWRWEGSGTGATSDAGCFPAPGWATLGPVPEREEALGRLTHAPLYPQLGKGWLKNLCPQPPGALDQVQVEE